MSVAASENRSPCEGAPRADGEGWHAREVAVLELVDETFVSAEPAAVAALAHDPARWASWWPGLTLTTFMDREVLGRRWSAFDDDWTGSVELWLEPVADGVLIHHYVRLDPTSGRSVTGRRVRRKRAGMARRWKAQAFALKDELEGGRRPGTRSAI